MHWGWQEPAGQGQVGKGRPVLEVGAAEERSIGSWEWERSRMYNSLTPVYGVWGYFFMCSPFPKQALDKTTHTSFCTNKER